MQAIRVVSWAALAACLVLLNATEVSGGETKKTTAKKRKESQRAYAPVRTYGAVPKSDPVDPSPGGTTNDTITEYRNELGQTVYSIKASRFDISPPLLEMAAAAESRFRIAVDESGSVEAEHDSVLYSEVPDSSLIRSAVLDPVVQSVIQPGAPRTFGFPLAAPTTGFNFAGIPMPQGAGIVVDRSDSNGSVGNNQFVEGVNLRYQVWSLNRATQTATPLFPSPVSIGALWAGFGGQCESPFDLYSDPIVLFDKIANRWLISHIAPTSENGVYNQCVAVSTSANATGTYARYAFAVPNGKYGDYPKFGVWPDAYYMTSNGLGGGGCRISRCSPRWIEPRCSPPIRPPRGS